MAPSRASRTPTRSTASSPPCVRPTQHQPMKPECLNTNNLTPGPFRPYGGSFVSETLTHAIDELRRPTPTSTTRSSRPNSITSWRISSAALARLPRRAHQPRDRRRADLPQARGPQPHRRAQDQQRHRPGHAGAAHGQAAHHCRDRRRPARRGHRHHLRALRPGMRGLHGRRGRQAPKPQRLSHEAAGRHRGAGRIRQQDAEGRLNEAMRDWVANVDNTFYIIGTVAGPTPTR